LENIRKGWRKLSFAIAAGVIEHIKAEMEMSDIQTKGEVTIPGSHEPVVVVFTRTDKVSGQEGT